MENLFVKFRDTVMFVIIQVLVTLNPQHQHSVYREYNLKWFEEVHFSVDQSGYPETGATTGY